MLPISSYRQLFCLKRAANFLTAQHALLVCALFLLVGAVVIADYDMGRDESFQRNLARMTIDYALGENDQLSGHWFRFYGVAFETPLFLVERGLGLTEGRSISLSRHILTHLFFILGGFCCYRLVYRLSKSRLLALFALLLFLLHPRLYAHSFINSKDLPFLTMFLIALYLLERAFRRDNIGAFVLLGIAVGLLTNIRIMGVMLFPAVLAMRWLDLFYADGWAVRQRILLTAAGFILAAVGILYATWPILWTNPVEHFLDSFTYASQLPSYASISLFRGEWIANGAGNPDFIPTWFVITTPPLILLLGVIGAAAVIGRGIARPAAIFRNTPLRFAFLLLASLILPVVAVILLNSPIDTDWRQMFFIYAPFCLLAVFGLGWLGKGFRQPGWRAGVYGLTGVGVSLIILQMAQLHPHQYFYFNFLVDRTTPEHLLTHYSLDYWMVPHRQLLEQLLEQRPGEPLYLDSIPAAAGFLPPADRQRLRASSDTRDPDYVLYRNPDHGRRPDFSFNQTGAVQIYNNTISVAKGVNADRMDAAAADAYRELYRQAKSSEPVIRADFDVYHRAGLLTFVREDCPPGALSAQFSAKVFPPDPKSAPGYFPERSSFTYFSNSGVRLGNTCLAVIQLPDYAKGDIIVGQRRFSERQGFPLWEELHSFSHPDLSDIIAAGRQNRKQPSPLNSFDVFLDQRAGGGNRLLYAKADCSRPDYDTRIFLHIYPVNSDSLPPERREFGFVNRDFGMRTYGGRPGGDCLAVVPLPDYPIAEIRTGQHAAGQGQLWSVELAVR